MLHPIGGKGQQPQHVLGKLRRVFLKRILHTIVREEELRPPQDDTWINDAAVNTKRAGGTLPPARLIGLAGLT